MDNNQLILQRCLSHLADGRKAMLKHHLRKNTPILCGCEETLDYFVVDGRSCPTILSCFKNAYPGDRITYNDLHQTVKDVYDSVAWGAKHAEYTIALSQLTQHQVRQVIEEL